MTLHEGIAIRDFSEGIETTTDHGRDREVRLRDDARPEETTVIVIVIAKEGQIEMSPKRTGGEEREKGKERNESCASRTRARYDYCLCQ